MRRLLVISLLGWLCAVPAQADAIYNWVSTSADGLSWGVTPVGLPQFGNLTFSDSVIASGSYTVSCGQADCPPGLADFGGFKFPGFNLLQANFSVHFNADGTLTGTTRYLDIFSEYALAGSEFDWSGTFNSDLLSCQPTSCRPSRPLTPIRLLRETCSVVDPGR